MMRNLVTAFTFIVLASVLSVHVQAKRGAPKDVAPVTKNGVVYSAPHEHMGFVVAKDEKNGHDIFIRQIYVVKYDPELEKDVQDCFISELRFDGDKLIVTNEKESQFELNPATLTVKVLKGSEVIDRSLQAKQR
jgi:hypothetical protein